MENIGKFYWQEGQNKFDMAPRWLAQGNSSMGQEATEWLVVALNMCVYMGRNRWGQGSETPWQNVGRETWRSISFCHMCPQIGIGIH